MAERAEETLRKAVELLQGTGVETAALDARLLLQTIAGVSHADILAGRVPPLSAEARARFEAAIARRAVHEPVHRILGRREFYGLELVLSPDTLEPRPDTEALVDLVLPFIQKAAAAKQLQPQCAASAKGQKAEARLPQNSGRAAASEAEKQAAHKAAAGGETKRKAISPNPPGGQAESAAGGEITLLDIGTGSGTIALALLAQVPQLRAVGADISAGACAAAQANAEALGLAARFQAVQSDGFSNISGQYDFIVSNPPYIPHGEIAALSAEVRLYDPLRALDGGADGLDFYRLLAAQSAAHLKPGGYIAVEIGLGQGEQVSALFAAAGFRRIETRRDLAGIERALLFSSPA